MYPYCRGRPSFCYHQTPQCLALGTRVHFLEYSHADSDAIARDTLLIMTMRMMTMIFCVFDIVCVELLGSIIYWQQRILTKNTHIYQKGYDQTVAVQCLRLAETPWARRRSCCHRTDWGGRDAGEIHTSLRPGSSHSQTELHCSCRWT